MKQTRNTKQREVVYEALKTLNGHHPTAQVVYEEVFKNHPHISRGTVYRNLGILSEAGIIRKISMGDGVDRYDDDISDHGHFICQECKQLLDVEIKNAISLEAIENQGFQVHTKDLILTGLCPDCLESNGG